MASRVRCLAVAAAIGVCRAWSANGQQAAPRPVDWDALPSESVATLRDYIRVNTTNPPGNEIEAARFLKRILDREGIPATILDTAELGPGHANLYARFRGGLHQCKHPLKALGTAAK